MIGWVIVALGLGEDFAIDPLEKLDIIPLIGEVDRDQSTTWRGQLNALRGECHEERCHNPVDQVEPFEGFGLAVLVKQDCVRALSLAKP